jgi:hypothetical protein
VGILPYVHVFQQSLKFPNRLGAIRYTVVYSQVWGVYPSALLLAEFTSKKQSIGIELLLGIAIIQ